MEQRSKVRMSRVRACVLASVLLLVLGSASGTRGAQTARANALLDGDTFEVSKGGWVALGEGGRVRLNPDAARVKTGKAALAFDYIIAPRQVAAAVLRVPGGSLARMKSLRFWLKTDSAAPVAVLLAEKKPGGGNYVAVVWSPKDTWQKIELTPSDFAPSDGPNDPRDPDGRLDLDQVEGVGLMDLGSLLSTLPENPDLPLVVEKRSGAHTLYVDGFEVRADASDTPPPGEAHIVIDDFHRGYLNWFTLGGAELSVSASNSPLAGRALEARYQQTQGRYVVLVHPLTHFDLSKVERLEFEMASEHSAQIILWVETRDSDGNKGPRYNTTLEVPANRRPVRVTVPFADFKLDEKGPPDPTGRLDPGRMKSIGFVDVTGATGVVDLTNTLWVAQIVAEPARPIYAGGSPSPHAHETSTTLTPVGQQMPMAMSHLEDARVTESMSSHRMHGGPHLKLTDLRIATPEDRERADEIVRTLRESLKKYTDYRVAIKDGYLPYLPNVPQREYHFTNYGYGYLQAFGFDPAHPTSLLYNKKPDSYELLGAMYTAPEKATERELDQRIPLSVARWHLHINVCLPQGGMTQKADWTKFGPGGSIATERECAEAGGKFLPHLFGWMVHVYPFEKTPQDVWAH